MRTPKMTMALALATSIGVAACSDPTTIDEHFEVEGFSIYEGTEEIYRYTHEDGDEPTLALEQGVHDVRFVLLDPAGMPITEDDHEAEHEEEHELVVAIGDASTLTWTPEPDGGHAHEHVEFHGELNALQPGSTILELCVPHGISHCDFEAEVPVTVVAP